MYPVVIVKDRYGGCYSDADWTAWNNYVIPSGAEDGDSECSYFWASYKGPVGKGSTPQAAYEDLKEQVEARKQDLIKGQGK